MSVCLSILWSPREYFSLVNIRCLSPNLPIISMGEPQFIVVFGQNTFRQRGLWRHQWDHLKADDLVVLCIWLDCPKKGQLLLFEGWRSQNNSSQMDLTGGSGHVWQLMQIPMFDGGPVMHGGATLWEHCCAVGMWKPEWPTLNDFPGLCNVFSRLISNHGLYWTFLLHGIVLFSIVATLRLIWCKL